MNLDVEVDAVALIESKKKSGCKEREERKRAKADETALMNLVSGRLVRVSCSEV